MVDVENWNQNIFGIWLLYIQYMMPNRAVCSMIFKCPVNVAFESTYT